ncbi:MAG TPA: hypothetical protein VNU19_09160 [Candidatus Acidoferrum sp.]|nr:hypothetical protein [Candidatus Acidoferrum sp.]
MASPNPESETVDAVDFAFSVATDKLSAQLATAGQVDTKLGVVIAALASVAALYSATSVLKVAGLLFIVPAAIAFFGFRAREWQNPPDPNALIRKYMNLGKTEMQLQALAVILEAYEANKAQLARKAALFNWALGLTLAAGVLVLILSVALPSGK